ncbi:MAG: arsenate reductase ArsC [Litorimonas sp.]
MADPYRVLFLCTGNSARSILSEAILNDIGAGSFQAFSAGSKPSGQPHPDALRELERRGHVTTGYSSKSWDAFAEDGAPELDLVVTVCDSAARESCPVFHGPGLRVHWPAPDPAHIEDAAARVQAFEDVYRLCRSRIEALVQLSEEALRDPETLQAIGRIGQ